MNSFEPLLAAVAQIAIPTVFARWWNVVTIEFGRLGPLERVAWGGLLLATLLSVSMIVDRILQIRKGRVVPSKFLHLCVERFTAGKIDWSQALDYCELNPSPATRVAVSCLRRWNESAAELERLAANAVQREVDRLRRNLGSLQRIALVAPLIGLFGSLATAGRHLDISAGHLRLENVLGLSLPPAIAAVALAVVILVAHDGLANGIERLAAMLEQIGLRVSEAMLLQLDSRSRHDRYTRAGVASVGRPHRPSVHRQAGDEVHDRGTP